jgi:hypothetical protein
LLFFYYALVLAYSTVRVSIIAGWLMLSAAGGQGHSIAIPDKFWGKNCVIDKG